MDKKFFYKMLFVILIISITVIELKKFSSANLNAKDNPIAIPNIIKIAVPGPRALPYLPIDLIHAIGADQIDLIHAIGADQKEGVDIKLIHTGGGAIALTHLIDGEVDFAASGLPGIMSLALNHQEVVAIAAIDERPISVLMVRQDLADQIKTLADLRGHTIGVNTSSKLAKTVSQQLIEFLLTAAGVPLNSVHIISAGQSWQQQSALLTSGIADAIMGDEQFASRLQQQGKVFFLANLADPEFSTKIHGANFLHAVLATRQNIINDNPQLVSLMVKIIKNTLAWIDQHSVTELVNQLKIQDHDEYHVLLTALKKYPHLYSRDGSFSAEQLHETDIFFANANPKITTENYAVQLVNDRWSGHKE